MSVVINSNYSAIVSKTNLTNAQKSMDRAFERLSLGKKTIHAADDAAGIAIAGRMESQMRALSVAANHAKAGQQMLETAEGSLAAISSVLQRMREIAVHASSGIASDSDREYLNLEMSSLTSQLDLTATNAKYNNIQLLKGAAFNFYTDMDVSGSKITTQTGDMGTGALGVDAATVSVGKDVTQASLSTVVAAIDNAIKTVDTKRSELGAISNRFDHSMDNLKNAVMTTANSKGVMIDADYSEESVKLTRSSILQNAATSMLAQSHAQKNSILTLFQS